MHNFLVIADALAPYVWPLVVVTLAVIFRAPLRGALGRATGVTVLGQRIELAVRIDDLRRLSVPLGSEILSTLPSSRESDSILKMVARSPQTALIQVGQSIEREVRLLAGAQGWLKDVGKKPLVELLYSMTVESGRDIELLRLIFNYVDLRKYLDSTHTKLTKRDARSAVEVSLLVLGLIEHFPREQLIVLEAGITLYTDAQGTAVNNDVQGLRIRHLNPGGQPKDDVEQVLISRDKSLRSGMNITWEWITDPEFDPHWYRDSDTGSMKPADIRWQYVGRDVATLM